MTSIEKTVRYFDLFDFPLSREEIGRWLWQERMSAEELHRAMDELLAYGRLEKKNAYYFLPGRQALVATRLRREKLSWAKVHKARRMAGLLRWVAGVRMIALASDVAYLNADEGADIDLFIVARRGSMWSARLWSVVLMKLLGRRPSKRTIKDKICLSYFVDEEHLNLKETALGGDDVHLVYLLSEYRPVYDEGGYWEKFVRANGWIKDYLPNFRYAAASRDYMVGARGRWLKRLLEMKVLGQARYRQIQLARMAGALREARQRGDKKVIIDEGILKLHVNDKRAEINAKLKKIWTD